MYILCKKMAHSYLKIIPIFMKRWFQLPLLYPSCAFACLYFHWFHFFQHTTNEIPPRNPQQITGENITAFKFSPFWTLCRGRCTRLGYQGYGYAQGGAEATQHFPLPELAGGFKIVAKAAHAAGQQASLFFGREAGQRIHCSVHHRGKWMINWKKILYWEKLQQ